MRYIVDTTRRNLDKTNVAAEDVRREVPGADIAVYRYGS